jgi:hypothetical protein
MKASRPIVRAIGWLIVVSALVSTALVWALIPWPEQAPDTRWSFPFDASSYVAFQVSFLLHDLTLVPGLALVAAWAWPSAPRVTRIGLSLIVASMAAGAAIELTAVRAATSSMTSTAATVLGTAYGVLGLSFGVGVITAGLALRRQPRTPGPVVRWTHSLNGVWTSFSMLPTTVFMPMACGRITIGMWFVLSPGVGVTILRFAGQQSAGGEQIRLTEATAESVPSA